MKTLALLTFVAIVVCINGQGLNLFRDHSIHLLKKNNATNDEIEEVKYAVDVMNKVLCVNHDLPNEKLATAYKCNYASQVPFATECEETFFLGKTPNERRRFICSMSRRDLQVMQHTTSTCIKQRIEAAHKEGETIKYPPLPKGLQPNAKPEEARLTIVRLWIGLKDCNLVALM